MNELGSQNRFNFWKIRYVLKKIETILAKPGESFCWTMSDSESDHVTIDIHTIPLYVPQPLQITPIYQVLTTFIYRPVYVEYPSTVIHPEEMV